MSIFHGLRVGIGLGLVSGLIVGLLIYVTYEDLFDLFGKDSENLPASETSRHSADQPAETPRQ